jgi:multiple sugar transport system substrate-binding protein
MIRGRAAQGGGEVRINEPKNVSLSEGLLIQEGGEVSMAEKKKAKSISRRDFIKAAGAGAVAAGLGANIITPGRALAGRKKLKIIRWGHWVPSFNKWFDKTFVKEWGEKNDTEVTVDHIPWGYAGKARAEIKAQKGHDLFMFPYPTGQFEEHVIDHRDIYEECEKRYGKPIPMAVKWTYNPITNKHGGFFVGYSPHLVNYRKDLWDGVGMYPNTWEDVRVGGAKIKKKYGHPVGIAISAVTDSAYSLRAIMFSYGASVQDEKGNVVINSKQTLEAVKFVRALYEEAMIPDVLKWDHSSNNRFMLRGKCSLTLNPTSITRWAEKENMTEISRKIWLAKPPAGPVRRMAVANDTTIYVIWKFAENIEGAKQFLVDYVGNSRDSFLTSGFYNMPSFPDTVPDLKKLIANDPKADPPDKYKVMEDAQEWTASLGYPGYGNAATEEFFNGIPEMFAKGVTGELTPEDAIKEAEAKCKDIFAAWKKKGLV